LKQLVSILIPAYNARKWLPACLESALAQTWSRKEIIVVDDGSTDATLEMARSYASSNVKVLTQENRGASAARNRALSEAQGDYIQWLDADDVLASDKIEIQLDQAEPGQSSTELLSGSWGKFYHVPEKARFAPDSLWADLDPKEWMFRKIDENLWMAIESWLVSRKLTEMAGPWNEEMSLDDDGEYFCRVLSHADRVRFIPESRCFCRRANLGMSHSFTLTDRKLDSMSASLFSYIRVMRSLEDSPRVRAACIKLLNRWAPEFYPERPDLLHQMRDAAILLGGEMQPPKIRAKYRWIQKVFGWQIAKKAQYTLPVVRSLAEYYRERVSVLAK
jgi:glycosyltransferase involved in cell wall biosynthesis